MCWDSDTITSFSFISAQNKLGAIISQQFQEAPFFCFFHKAKFSVRKKQDALLFRMAISFFLNFYFTIKRKKGQPKFLGKFRIPFGKMGISPQFSAHTFDIPAKNSF